jgi:hypothetical protein
VDEILKIARDSSRDYVKKVGVDGKVTWVVDREHIARCGLRISALTMDGGSDGTEKVRQATELKHAWLVGEMWVSAYAGYLARCVNNSSLTRPAAWSTTK